MHGYGARADMRQVAGNEVRTTAATTARAADPIVEFFDRRANDYDREYGSETPAGFALRVRRRKVLELFDQPGGKVLDVGCGPGVMAQEIVSRNCRFWGVDPSANMIAIARSRFYGADAIEFVQGGAARLEFGDGFFDAVLCMGVIDSLRDGPHAMREMLRVLKPGGTLIVSFANLLSPYGWWKNYVFYPAVEKYHDVRARLGDPAMASGRRRSGSLRSLYTRRQAERLVDEAGGQVRRVVPYYFNVFIPPLDELFPRTALYVTERMERWARPQWIAAGWIVQARKRES
jgi:ubiquinone/menaquinone biosynthesis C-methylase UbiE